MKEKFMRTRLLLEWHWVLFYSFCYYVAREKKSLQATQM
jgi:hypothetical protein